MHPCLTVSEVLQVIVEHVACGLKRKARRGQSAANTSSAIDRQSVTQAQELNTNGTNARSSSPTANLAALARTCKTISGIALDRLWHTHTGLLDLVRCLPEETWSMNGRGGLVLESTVGANDWDRFDYYARRIRVLHISEPDHKGVFDSILQALSFRELTPATWANASSPTSTHVTQVIFPRLIELRWYSSSLTASVRIRLFFGPELQILILSCAGHLPTLEASLTYLPALSPHIKHLQLHAGESTFAPHTSARFGATLSKLSRLRILTLKMPTNVPLDALRALPELLLLEQLNIGKLGTAQALFPYYTATPASDTSSPPEDKSDAALNAIPLPSLKHLTITEIASNDFECCSLFLRSFPPPRLQVLVIDSEAEAIPTAASISSFIRTVAFVVDPASLKYLHIEVEFSGGSRTITAAEQVTERIDMNIFKPLLAFHNLLQFDFAIPSPESTPGSVLRVSLDDTALERMASAWPALRCLSVQGYASRMTDALPTIDAVATLVSRCPDLENVRLDFDASALGPPIPAQPPARGVSNTVITQLHVQRSKIADPFRVAAYLHTLFPNLTQIISSFGQYEETYRRWRQVEDAIPTFAAYRAWNCAR